MGKLSKNPNYKILITSRKNIVNEIKPFINNENVLYVSELDMTKENDIDKLCVKAEDFFRDSQFHVINCLGRFTSYDLIEKIDINTAKNIFEGNIVSLYSVAYKLLPIMKQRSGGHFIGFTAHTNYQHFPFMAAYTAAKAAVESLIMSISNEYLKYGIYSNVIALSTLLTNVEIGMKPNGDFDAWLNPEEVADIVENLVVNSNGLINGSVIHTYKYSDSYFGQSYYERIGKTV